MRPKSQLGCELGRDNEYMSNEGIWRRIKLAKYQPGTTEVIDTDDRSTADSEELLW
jgi:hypothetical protein